MKLKDFLYRYTSFTLAKVTLLIGRSAILILSYQWLSIAEFALIAGAFSFVEILRALTDVGPKILFTQGSHLPISQFLIL